MTIPCGKKKKKSSFGERLNGDGSGYNQKTNLPGLDDLDVLYIEYL